MTRDGDGGMGNEVDDDGDGMTDDNVDDDGDGVTATMTTMATAQQVTKSMMMVTAGWAMMMMTMATARRDTMAMMMIHSPNSLENRPITCT